MRILLTSPAGRSFARQSSRSAGGSGMRRSLLWSLSVLSHGFCVARLPSSRAAMALSKTFLLNDGNRIPAVGLGTYLSASGEETERAVRWALEAGYRHIDTAEFYGNEADVGRAIRNSGIPREQVFVTTKLWPTGKDYARSIQACEASLQKLGLDYVDLYLLHAPTEIELRREQWRALEDLRDQGKVKSIGVSNYGEHHLQELFSYCRYRPTVNQVELSPYLTRNALVAFCKQHDIVLEAYSPLTKGRKLNDPKLVEMARKYNKTPAQILLRWCLQHDFVIIPKTVKQERLHENADIDFEISEADMEVLDGFNENLVTGWDPTVKP